MEGKDVSISTTCDIKINNAALINKNSDTVSYNISHRLNTSNVYVLAKAFLSIAPMTHKKLQKLCYYAKAWYLAIYDENLIDEQFQAWVHGAVQPALYAKYRSYGFENIPKIESIETIPEEFISFANEIYESYGHLTGDELEVINHQEEPWIKARGHCKPWEKCTNEILEEDMKTYYRKMMLK